MAAALEVIDITYSSPRQPSPNPPQYTEIEFINVIDTKPKSESRKRKKAVSDIEDGELLEAPPGKSKTGRTVKKPQRHRSRSRSIERSESRRERRRREQRARSRDRNSPPPPPPPRHHSRSPERHGRRHRDLSPSAPSNEPPALFIIDTTPVLVPDKWTPKEPASNGVDAAAADLLLPSHVSVLGSGVLPVEIHSPVNSDQEENEDDYIDYLDYDDDRRAGVVRYFDETATESRPVKFVCKNCGEEGAHKTRECPVQICLTCGARDEHSTRSCPISKTCYTCGMRGHINKTCPNRHSQTNTNKSHDDCNRCGSRSHYTNECPTLWRIYEFVTDRERDTVLRAREEKRDLPLGQGGEGYIAADDWCYNCGECGHLGDDCTVIPHQPGIPREPSAFSEYNTRSGPFFDPTIESSKKPRSRTRRTRDWEVEGGGFQPPLEVGKRGRKKEKVRMEKIANELVELEDENDWFSRQGNVGSRGMPPPAEKGKGKIKFTVKDGGKRFGGGAPTGGGKPSSAPALLARLSDQYDDPGSRSKYENRGERDRNRDYSRGKDQYRSRDRPRYSGGYA